MTVSLDLIPAEVARRLTGEPHLVWLDSAPHPADDPTMWRYSLVAAAPRWVVTVDGAGTAWIVRGQRRRRLRGSVLDLIDAVGRRVASGGIDGGAPVPELIGYLAYELGHAHEPPRPGTGSVPAEPLAWLGRYDAVYRYDHLTGEGVLLGEGPVHRRILGRLRGVDGLSDRAGQRPRFAALSSNLSPGAYRERVEQVLEAIRAGDVYQVNLAQRLRADRRSEGDPLALYERLRRLSPAPFGAYLDLGERQILSNSPERLLRAAAAGRLETRPIKGTRPRAAQDEGADGDDRLRRELSADPKERAEHVMIVDLERNDLGKVAVPGSVRVEVLMRAETYAHVHHLVSVVSGDRRPEAGLAEVLRAIFPGGSITGAPKRRAVEMIARLEPAARGVYCGSVGWFGRGATADLSVAIRTAVLDAEAISVAVGGGIVADSTVLGEHQESWTKAGAFLRLLED